MKFYCNDSRKIFIIRVAARLITVPTVKLREQTDEAHVRMVMAAKRVARLHFMVKGRRWATCRTLNHQIQYMLERCWKTLVADEMNDAAVTAALKALRD